ncbi:MAG: hypothetical protein WKF84_06105 [Pyrinomonadaceae bacterium]
MTQLKGTFFNIVFTAALLLLTANSGQAQSSEAAELNLGQYYALLTPAHMPILDKYKNRDSLAKETDYPNSYMLFVHEEWKGWGEMALFKKKGGGHLVVVTQYDCQQQYPSYPYYQRNRCAGNAHFLELKGKELVEAKNVVPEAKTLQLYGFYEKKTKRLADSDDKLIYELPRERKDIRIRLADQVLYSLMWDGQKFVGSYVE